MIAMVVSVRINPERREDFLKAIAEDSRGSREDEPGCLRFDVLQDAADPNHYFFYEVYRNEDALKAHRAAPHYQGWGAFRDSGGVIGSTDATRCNTVFPVEAKWRPDR